MSTTETKPRTRRPKAEVDIEKIQDYFDGLSLGDKIKLVQDFKAAIKRDQDNLTASPELITSSNL